MDATISAVRREPWNKGKLVGQKAPLKVKDIWAIEVPESDYSALGRAIADLENTEPLLSLQRVVIHAVPEQPQYQQVSLDAETALFKR